MSLGAGQKIAHYEILEPIGKGGMGEVFRAKDTKLGRDVAIKVLPDEFADSDERLARFEREATVLASLNHPNIGGIHGLEDADGLRFLVLELVPGDTLGERLKGAPVPLHEALDLAGQIADALAAAHDGGVVHRDLKPANIKITPEGQIKVLDFGLAKALVDDPGDGELSNSPTLSAHATKMGVILGTAAYMSPEQARGRAVDKRTDIFSFGVVLYEMLTGRQLFRGEDPADTMASVIRSDPDLGGLPSQTPQRVRELLTRCLEKDPNKRRRDLSDVSAELEAPYETTSVPARKRQRRPWLPLAGALASGLLTGIVVWFAKSEPEGPIRRFEMVLPDGAVFNGTNRRMVAMSPRGTHLAYVANDTLYIRALDRVDAVPIQAAARLPFFSPDGDWLGFYADRHLKKVAVSGGAPVTLCAVEARPNEASWGADGTIVFAVVGRGILEVSANGGEPRVLVEADGQELHHGPQKLPGGDAVLSTLYDGLSRWDQSTIVIDNIDTGERKVLLRGGTDARYVPTGHIVYAVDTTIFTVGFDLENLEVTGDPASAVEGVVRQRDSGAAQFSFSEDGTLAFAVGTGATEQSLLWVDRDGRATRVTEEVGEFSTPRLSPDGKRLAVGVSDDDTDVWILDLERDTFTQLTNDGVSRHPGWSPDGKWLVVSSDADLSRFSSDFSGTPESMLEGEGVEAHPQWMPDGAGIVYQVGFGSGADLWLLDLEGETEPTELVRTPANDAQPDVSPDGRYLVYHSSVSGNTSQIFVQPLAGGGGRLQISTDGGSGPRWSPTGREIFYHDNVNQTILAVDVQTEPELTLGPPRVLFEWPIGPGFSRHWDVAPDGQRFVVLGRDESAETRPRIQFVLNWFTELERLVPAP